MKQGECVQDFVTRVLDIVYQIRMMKEEIPQKYLVSKILRSLTPRFSLVVHSIIEAKDLNTLAVEKLSSSLRIMNQFSTLKAVIIKEKRPCMLVEVQHNSVNILSEVEEVEVAIFPGIEVADVGVEEAQSPAELNHLIRWTTASNTKEYNAMYVKSMGMLKPSVGIEIKKQML